MKRNRCNIYIKTLKTIITHLSFYLFTSKLINLKYWLRVSVNLMSAPVLSAGLIKAETLSISGAQAGAIQATNLDFDNLNVSGDVVVRGNLQHVLSDPNFEVYYNDAVSAALKKYKLVHKPTSSTVCEWDSLSDDLLIFEPISAWGNFMLDPVKVDYGALINEFNSFTWRTLLQKDPEGNIIPDLATDLGTHSNAYKTWTFTLKSDIKYEDGTTVTPADIKYSLSRFFDPALGDVGLFPSILDLSGNTYLGPYNVDQSGKVYFDNAVTVDSSENSITFNFKDAQPDLLNILLPWHFIPIPEASDVPEKYWRPGQNSSVKHNPLSCGPYKITLIDTKGIVYEPNTYWSNETDAIRLQTFTKIYTITTMSIELANAILENDIMPNSVGLNILYGVPTKVTTKCPGRYMGVADFKAKYPERVGDVGVGIYAKQLAFTLGIDNLTDYNARAAIFWGANIQSVIDKYGGDSLATLQDSLGNAVLYPDYQPTTNNIHDSSFNKLGNSTVASHYMNLLQISNPALYTRMTTTGVNLLEYTGVKGVYDGMVASLKEVGIVLNVTTVTKNEFYYLGDSDPLNTSRYNALCTNPKWDMVNWSFGSSDVLDLLTYMVKPSNIPNDEEDWAGFTPGFVVGGQVDPVTKDIIVMDSDYQSMLDILDQAAAETDPAVKQTKITQAMNICLDNYFIIFPINGAQYTIEGSLLSGANVAGNGLGGDFKQLSYIC